MQNNFLKNEHYTFLIAKIATVFQSFITCAIAAILLAILFEVSYPRTILLLLLWADVMFVVAHLSYRKAYRGPKVFLKKSEKLILIFHSITALLALCMTFMIVGSNLSVGTSFITFTLVLWVASLILGVLFFRRKYRDGRVFQQKL